MDNTGDNNHIQQSDNSINFFIYVINLDKDVKRLKEMELKLSPNKFTRVPAIYGNTDDMKKYDNIFPSSHFLTPRTVLATGLSHKKAIETYLKDVEKYCNTNHTGTHDTDTHNTDTNHTDTHKTGTHNTDTHNTETNHTGTHKTDTNHTGTHNIDITESVFTTDNTIGLILEDDAIPIRPEYMKEIETAVKNAPEDWDIIKLDYLPKLSFHTYNKIPTTLFTAYLINHKGALKYKNSIVCYHVDMEIWFKDIVVYNNPTVVFKQIWNNQNGSNNQTVKWYNPLSNMSYITNYKVIRVFTNEYTIADLILLILVLLSIIGASKVYGRLSNKQVHSLSLMNSYIEYLKGKSV
jgi:hypothetical protein